MTDRKFHRYVFTYEVLSEHPIPARMGLADMLRETEEGDFNGNLLESHNEIIDGETAARLLLESGSDPCFFRLTEDGEDDD